MVIHSEKVSESLSDLEDRIRKDVRLSKIQSAVIASVGAAAALALVALAPNIFQILKIGNLDKKMRHRKLTALSRARHRLIEQGILLQSETENGPTLRLSKKGEALFAAIELKKFKIKIPKKWDKKWRVVIFDIKEKRKGTRDELRSLLQKIGLLQIQKSAYIYPYPCNELVALIKAHYGVGESLLYMIVEQIENDRKFKRYFGIH
ncbi:MAG: hypothetical protein ABI430_00430 [Candidatus Taylorbacteria bacterium]